MESSPGKDRAGPFDSRHISAAKPPMIMYRALIRPKPDFFCTSCVICVRFEIGLRVFGAYDNEVLGAVDMAHDECIPATVR